MIRTTLAALAVAAATVTAGDAATANRFTSLAIFGDSLSDPGNLFALTGGLAPPSPPYAERFSDGPVWAEHLAADFNRAGLPTANYAHGGATATGLPSELPAPIPNLADQLASYLTQPPERLGAAPAVIVWIGANDFFRQAESDPAPAAVAARMTAAAQAVLAAASDLSAGGAEQVLVFNLPPLELTPAFAMRGPEAAALATFATRSFNDPLAAGIDGLAAAGLGVGLFDIEEAFRGIFADPASLGLTNVSVPCYVQSSPPDTRCPDAVAAVSLFFDTVHPAQVVHAEIANRVRHEIAPIPLPAPFVLLIAGLATLTLVARRRA